MVSLAIRVDNALGVFAPAPPPPGEETLYDGLTPTVYAAPASLGNGSGSSEANAIALSSLMSTVGPGAVVGLQPANGAGSYFAPAANTDQVYFQPASGGTSTNPITFVAKYPALSYPNNPELWSEFRQTNPVFGPTLTAYNANRPILGSSTSGPSYITWIGPYINMAFTSTRPSHGTIKAGFGATNVKFKKFRFELVETPYDISDNMNMIFMDRSIGTEVSFCRFHGLGAAGGFYNHNVAGITFYGAHAFLIQNCDFLELNNGMFIKGAPGGVFNYGTVKFCLFKDNQLSGLEIADAGDGITLIEQNVFIACTRNIAGGEGGCFVIDHSTQHAWDVILNHNTFFNATQGSPSNAAQAIRVRQTDYQRFTCTNNVVYFASGLQRRAMMHGNFAGLTPSGQTTSNYNLWHGVDGGVLFEDNTGTYTGRAAWQAASGEDANSSEENPSFADITSLDLRRLGNDVGSSTSGRRGAYKTNLELIGTGT